MMMSTLNKKRVCGPSKRVHETIKKRVSGEDHEKSLRQETTKRVSGKGPQKESADHNEDQHGGWPLTTMSKLNKSPARRLAVDDDVDVKQKSSTEAGRRRRCRR
jgi:hypothetical protein